MKRILYFEDLQKDAVRFAALLLDLMPEKVAIQTDTITLQAFFQERKITWVSYFETAKKKIQNDSFDIYLLDLEYSNYGMVGMKLVEMIRSLHPNNQPQIWIYSIMGHYRQKMFHQFHVDEFFCKDGDQTRLRNHLEQAYGLTRCSDPSEETKIPVYMGKSSTYDYLPLDQIICIVSSSQSCEVRLLSQGKLSYESRIYYRTSNLMPTLLQEMEAGRYTSLHLIAKGVIINENMINRVLRSNGIVQFEMYQHAGIYTVGRSYLHLIEEFLGKDNS